MYEYAIYMHVEFYGMCIVSSLNGTRCRDGVKVLWSRSHLFTFFYGSIPTCACFHSENLFGTCSCCFLLLLLLLFFVLLFRNSKGEEAGGEAEGKLHGL